jgi:hypothetical protein
VSYQNIKKAAGSGFRPNDKAPGALLLGFVLYFLTCPVYDRLDESGQWGCEFSHSPDYGLPAC